MKLPTGKSLTEYHLKRIVRCRGVVPLWDKKWSKSAKDKKAEKKPISILPTLARCSNFSRNQVLYKRLKFRCFWFDFFWSAILTAISSVLQFASPLLVNQLIGCFSFNVISNVSLQSHFQVCRVVRAIVERLLLHSVDHHRHCCHNRDQQPVCFQTVDDWIAGSSKLWF